jgi:hypothetical protein
MARIYTSLRRLTSFVLDGLLQPGVVLELPYVGHLSLAIPMPHRKCDRCIADVESSTMTEHSL